MSDEFDKLYKDQSAAEESKQHPEDEAHISSDEEETEEEAHTRQLLEDLDNDDYEPDMPFFGNSTSLAHSNYNTGVKGVIADAHSFEKTKRREMRELRERNNQYSRPSISRPSTACPSTAHSRGRSVSQVPIYLSDDDELMVAWRKNRLAELKASSSTTRRQSPSKRHFGRVEHVDAMGYLDAIEKVSKDTVVVVAVYSERSHESSFVLDCLSTVARKYPTTRFIQMHHTEAEMDVDVVPAILAYRGGELFHSIMSVVDEIPSGRSLSTESLELVLQRQRILMKE